MILTDNYRRKREVLFKKDRGKSRQMYIGEFQKEDRNVNRKDDTE